MNEAPPCEGNNTSKAATEEGEIVRTAEGWERGDAGK